MLGDTITLTVGGGPKVLNKINQDSFGSEYLLRESTQEFRMRIRHSKVAPKGLVPGMDRHNAELSQTIFGSDGAPDEVKTTYIVIQEQPRTQDKTLSLALYSWLSASSGATVDKLLTWQS